MAQPEDGKTLADSHDSFQTLQLTTECIAVGVPPTLLMRGLPGGSLPLLAWHSSGTSTQMPECEGPL